MLEKADFKISKAPPPSLAAALALPIPPATVPKPLVNPPSAFSGPPIANDKGPIDSPNNTNLAIAP